MILYRKGRSYWFGCVLCNIVDSGQVPLGRVTFIIIIGISIYMTISLHMIHNIRGLCKATHANSYLALPNNYATKRALAQDH